MPDLPASTRRVTRRTAIAAVLATAATGLTVLAAAPASAVVPTAPVPLPAAIEVMPPYQPQVYCDPRVKPGVAAFGELLTSTYRGTSIVSDVRACGSDTSEHYDGRALDWGVNVANDRQRAQGKALLHWLFATDDAGHRYAMLRRLGVMYIIWNSRIWGAWSHSWEPYACSGVTACHKDHMHLSFDWSGAEQRTSFWTGVVRDPMPTPLLTLRKLHRPQTATVDVRDDDPRPIYRLVAGGRYRLTVHGRYRYDDRRAHRADAECSTRDRTTWVKRPDGAPAAQLDLVANGVSRWRPTGTAVDGCSATHDYHRTLTSAVRQPLRLVIDDPQRWSGDGSLTVTVERVG